LNRRELDGAALQGQEHHVREDMVGVYDTHDYLDEKRAALQKWSAI
jgi:hypothetical protein